MTANVLVVLVLAALAQVQPRDAARQRPSEYVTCPRDQLTSYTGFVSDYRRENARTTLTIRTDWETTEKVELKHPGTDDPSRWFLLRGRPFTPDDWKELEVERGRLKPKMRATAWVCDDGRNPIVDWSTRPESR